MSKLESRALQATRAWVSQVVVAYQLCPFARVPWQNGTIDYRCVAESSPKAIHGAVLQACRDMETQPETAISTVLLILLDGYVDFRTYWQLVGQAEVWLEDAGYEGVFQIASFHPHYRFAGAEPDAAQNYTNRSPLPMLHLIREDQIAAAVAQHPDIESVPQRNIALMEAKGTQYWKELNEKIYPLL